MATANPAAKREEHILVCLSPSPSNQGVIKAAAKLAAAFGGSLTAIYIKPSDYESMPDIDKHRLQDNFQYAERHGATVTMLIGDDIPQQISEYAHISGTTKIVIGRNAAGKTHFWSKAPLIEQLILRVPDVDVYIIPDSAIHMKYHRERIRGILRIRPTKKDLLLTFLFLLLATGLGLVFHRLGFSEANIITVYILGVLVTSIWTDSPVSSLISSLASVFLFNYFFIEPRFSLHTYEAEYVVTFVIMLTASLITGTLANKLKEAAGHAAHEAFRTKVLLDTSQLLQKAEDTDAVLQITAGQIITLLDRDVIIYKADEHRMLDQGSVFPSPHSDGTNVFGEENETRTVQAVFERGLDPHRKITLPDTKALYQAIGINGYCYGVLGIRTDSSPLEAFEYSISMSIIGECALALDSLRNAAEKERAAIMAQNEQLRADLLRTISHDIRTPLTAISGNASNLLSHYDQLDHMMCEQIFSDIYDDSQWLINLVENLLSISRMENGKMNLHISSDVVNDIIDEALKHVDRRKSDHKITVNVPDEIFLARMDARLITQVLINLINNAIKHTPAGSAIVIGAERTDGFIAVSVSDNGPGIPGDIREHVFEMFYTGGNKIVDGRRGLGLGLALCKTIVEAHGGTIAYSDNDPTGSCFTFTLPSEEVNIHE